MTELPHTWLPCVLLVEDDCVDAEAVRRAFTRYGIRNPLQRARDGLEGLDILRDSARRPCLIIVDLRMPRMDGLEFLAELRSDPDLGAIPVAVCTTSDDPRDREASMRHDPVAFIVKSELEAHLPPLADLIDAAAAIA